jgi:hypothetical protein
MDSDQIRTKKSVYLRESRVRQSRWLVNMSGEGRNKRPNARKVGKM